MNDPSRQELISLHSKMGFWDILRVGSSGIRTRRIRAVLSMIGITIGIAALVGILGLSQSGSADLFEGPLDALGTNLLTVQSGDGFRSEEATLPSEAVGMVSRIGPVYEVSATTKIKGTVFK